MAIDRRILIADDDLDLRRGAVELLDALGLEVLEASDGEEALAVVRAADVLHLVLLDFHMPGRDGLEVFGLLRQSLPDLPCIFWSGDATEAIERTALRAGASAFLRKPVRPDVLRGEVRRVLADRWGEPF